MTLAIRIPESLKNQVKRATYTAIMNIGIESYGIIFGGFVRDEFISEYYTEKFYREHSKYDKKNTQNFWDAKYSPETKNRLLIPKDIDICFYSDEEAESFISKIKENPEFDAVSLIINNSSKYYNSKHIKNVHTIDISVRIGKIPFISEGILVKFNVDVVISATKGIEPPFDALDFLCNGFIITKDNQKRFSKHSGTIIDQYSDYDKIVSVAQIVRDLVELKTVICMCVPCTNKSKINIIALERITKMDRKKVGWTFINLPFEQKIYDDTVDSDTTDCCICSCNIKNNQKIAYTLSVNSEGNDIPAATLHYNCLLKYLHHQKENIGKKEKLHFICPYRNVISFKNCKYDITRIYNNDLY